MGGLFELYGVRTDAKANWRKIVKAQRCPYTEQRCVKTRKSDPSITIGTCTGCFGIEGKPLIICPKRFLANRQVFTDCLPLLRHRAGNELHIVPEIQIPGGNVDFFLVSAKNGEPKEFVGIEFQGLDTTGSVWPIRQMFLRDAGLEVSDENAGNRHGVNWKMTAKTTLIQLHHKVETFEALNRKLVLVLQSDLMDYMAREFSFGHLSSPAESADSMYFHAYVLNKMDSSLKLGAVSSTNRAGISTALNLGASAEMKPEELIRKIRLKMNENTRWDVV